MEKILTMRSLNFLLYIFIFVACSQNGTVSKNDRVTTSTIKLLLSNRFGLIDYAESDSFDTQIGISNNQLVILNYNLGHASFDASSANLLTFSKETITSSRSGNVEDLNAQFVQLVDSLGLTKIVLDQIVSRSNDSISSEELKQLGISKSDLLRDPTGGVSASRNQVKKVGNVLLHLSYSKEGITELRIFKDGQLSTNVLSEELRINSPCITLRDITGDGKSELFVFYPSVDYWDSESYQVDLYDISDFYSNGKRKTRP